MGSTSHCTTPGGNPCYREDLARRFYSQFQAETCSVAQQISTPGECDFAITTAKALFRMLRNVCVAAVVASNIVGAIGQLIASRMLNLPLDTGGNSVRWLINGIQRTLDFVNLATRTAYEGKYAGEFRIT